MRLLRWDGGRVAALAVLGGAGVSMLMAFVSVAPAQGQVADPDYWKQASARSDSVYSFIYRQAPQTVPTSYSPVSGPAASLTTDFRALSPVNPQVDEVWRQARTTTSVSSLSPGLRALGTIGLAVGAFDLGWKIGSGVNAKFLKVGIPANGSFSTYSSPEITFRTEGETAGLWRQIPMPEDGWSWSIYSSAFSWQRSTEYRGPGTTYCTSQIFIPPPAFTEVSIPMGCGSGPGTLRIAYLPENGLPASGPAEAFTSQPYDRSTTAPAPPAQSVVEDVIEEQLDKPESNELRQWLNYKLGSPGEQDPLGEGPANPAIEFPGFYPHWEEHGDDFTSPYDDPLEPLRSSRMATTAIRTT